jgi:hypothetical protein
MARAIDKVRVVLRGFDGVAPSICFVDYQVTDDDFAEIKERIVDEAPATDTTLTALCQASLAAAKTKEGI